MTKGRKSNLKRFRWLIVIGLLALAAFLFLQENNPIYAKFVDNSNSEEASNDKSLGSTIYSHPNYSFSFQKPNNYDAHSIQERVDNVESLLFQDSKVISGENNFRISITLLSEDIELNPESVKQIYAGTEVSKALKIKLDKRADGIMFFSNNSKFKENSFEIWFVYGAYLYQVSSFADFSDNLQEITGTWRFK